MHILPAQQVHGSLTWRGAQEEEAAEAAAQEAVSAEVQRRAAARAAWLAAARRGALEWLRGPLPPAAAAHAAENLALLRDALAALYPSEYRIAPAVAMQEELPTPRFTAAVGPFAGAAAAPGAVTAAGAASGAPSSSAPDAAAAEPCEGGAEGGGAEAGPASRSEQAAAVSSSGVQAAGGQLNGAAAGQHAPGGEPAATKEPLENGHLVGMAQLQEQRLNGAAAGEGSAGSQQGQEQNERVPDIWALTEALDALRELGSLHVTLPLLAGTGLMSTFRDLSAHEVGPGLLAIFVECLQTVMRLLATQHAAAAFVVIVVANCPYSLFTCARDFG